MLNYQSPSEEARERHFRARPDGLVSCALGAIALLILAYGLVVLQDKIVGQVADSHFTAWVRTTPPPAVLSVAGLLIGIRAMIRGRGSSLPILGIILSAVSMGIAIASIPGVG